MYKNNKIDIIISYMSKAKIYVLVYVWYMIRAFSKEWYQVLLPT